MVYLDWKGCQVKKDPWDCQVINIIFVHINIILEVNRNLNSYIFLGEKGSSGPVGPPGREGAKGEKGK